mgnify:CR=1 FL=1
MRTLYHGSRVTVEQPEIRIQKFHKDFYWGFYCTEYETQATRWATRFGSGIVNVYQFEEQPGLSVKRFPEMSDEWLDFIVACRSAQIIVGPIGIAIADALMGEISPAMANAVASSNAYRVLIPMNLCSTYVAGVDKKSPAILDDAMAHIRSLLEGMENKP